MDLADSEVLRSLVVIILNFNQRSVMPTDRMVLATLVVLLQDADRDTFSTNISVWVGCCKTRRETTLFCKFDMVIVLRSLNMPLMSILSIKSRSYYFKYGVS